MSPELSEKLYEKYPLVFKRKRKLTEEEQYDPRKGKGYSVYDFWGIEVGDGWFHILEALAKNITEQIEKNNLKNFKVLQIKEKFGGLRFYCRGGNDKIQEYVDHAEELSMNTCESCGQLGLPQNDSWIKVLCQQCKERKNY